MIIVKLASATVAVTLSVVTTVAAVKDMFDSFVSDSSDVKENVVTLLVGAAEVILDGFVEDSLDIEVVGTTVSVLEVDDVEVGVGD